MFIGKSILFATMLDKVKSKKVLEVGVASGGTTCILLDLLNKQDKGLPLYSVDLNKNFYRDERLLTGYKVEQSFPDLMKNWKLLTGKLLPDCIEDIGGGIDLVVLDTVHSLPGELIDFPVLLPFLNDGAWVILHDTNLSTHSFKKDSIATRVVFDTVVAEKHLYYENIDGQKCLPNIGALRIGPDTRKYIVNCFTAMAMPWVYTLSKQEFFLYKRFYHRYYEETLVELFELAYVQNCQGVKNRAEERHLLELKAIKNFLKGAYD